MSAEAGAAPAVPVLQCPAYPALVRTLALVLLADIAIAGLWSLPRLRAAEWSTGGLLLVGMALAGTFWTGSWVVRSVTRLEGDMLTQTWLWTKQAHAADVAGLKLVHLPWLRRIVAPRLLVRRRGGGFSWFHAADVQVLHGFAARAAASAGGRS